MWIYISEMIDRNSTAFDHDKIASKTVKQYSKNTEFLVNNSII